LTVFGSVFQHFCPDKREIWLRSAPPCQISRLSEQSVAPAGRKTHFGPPNKNNTGMAALHAGQAVTRNQYESPPEGNAIPAGPLSDFFCKTRREGRCPRSLKMWAYRRRNRENWYFWYKVYPLKRFLQNLEWGSDSQARTLLPNLTIATFKISAYSTQNCRNW